MTRTGQRATLVLSVIATAAGAVIAAIPAAGVAPSPTSVIPEALFRPVTTAELNRPPPSIAEIRDFLATATPRPSLAPRPAPTGDVATITISTPKPPVRASSAPSPAPTAPTIAQTKAWALATLGSTQYACLAHIVDHEDGTWDPYRTNASSGAYGIPQALPGSKMATAGDDWRWNRITQVRWMIGYVDARYGSPCGAWTFWQSHSWY